MKSINIQNDFIQLSLLCSKQSGERIKGAIHTLVTCLQLFALQLDKGIMLFVSKVIENHIALKYYKGKNFKQVADKQELMVWNCPNYFPKQLHNT